MANINDEGEFEYRQTGMWVDGELVPVVARLQKPQAPRPMPPLLEAAGCSRGCPDSECYCAEPMVSDFLFPDGDENGWEGDYE